MPRASKKHFDMPTKWVKSKLYFFSMFFQGRTIYLSRTTKKEADKAVLRYQQEIGKSSVTYLGNRKPKFLKR